MLSITTNSDKRISDKQSTTTTNEMYQSQKPQTQPRQPISADQAKKSALSKGKSFCKVCFDAGKPESSYTSHYLKSSPGPDGKLVCPTLLNQSCLTCGQTGHTSSYCTERNGTERNEVQMTQRKRRTQKTHEVQDTFDTFTQVATKQDPEPLQEEEPRHHPHRYNPRSNVFGTLEPKEPIPMTMAQRLTQKTQKTQKTQMLSQAPIPLPDLGPKSQFWWQDLDD